MTSKKRSADIIDKCTDSVSIKTNNKVFDQYVKQAFLDNALRGGYPMVLGRKDPKPFYLYGRKHGDLEREYNFFSLSPEYYSQGNGNYRDVCQNRRNDLYINPELKTFNIKMFMNLIQMDGYNPLSVDAMSYSLRKSTLSK